MLTQTFLAFGEAGNLEKRFKSFRLIGALTLIIGVPLEILLGFLASLANKMVFWPVTILGLGLLTFAYYVIFVKGLRSIKQDLSEQVKLVGELEVVSKTQKEKQQLLIGFNSEELDKISLSRSVYDKISIGDVLYVEFSKYAHEIFKLSKNGEALINSSDVTEKILNGK